MDERAAAELGALRDEDEDLAADSARLGELEAAVASIRAQAEAIRSQLEAHAHESGRLQAAAVEAAEVLARRRAVVAAAERELETPRDDATWARLERVALRARERETAATRRYERAVAELEQLEGDVAELPAELVRLEAEARAVVARAPRLPDPASGIAGVIEWASHAHAELFVAASQLDRRREQVIREANELASMLLGEPTYGSTVAQAVSRVEQLR